jgi:hypothetical protein
MDKSLRNVKRAHSIGWSVAIIGVLCVACGGDRAASGSADPKALRFAVPFSAAIDGDLVFVTDTGNHTINVIDTASGTSTVLAGQPGSSGIDNGTGLSARFNLPKSVIVIGPDLFVADSGNYTIRKVVRATGETTTLAGAPGQSLGPIDGIGPNAGFGSPKALAADGQDVLYLADAFNNVIRRVVISTAEVTTVVDQSVGLSTPEGVAVTDQYVFIADTDNHVIRRLDKVSGQVTIIAGTEDVSGSQDGDGAVATFFHPHGLARFGSDLYIADSDNQVIRHIDLANTAYPVSTVVGQAGIVGTADGVGAEARFNTPEGVSTDGTQLIVADTFNSTIRRVDLATRAVTTLRRP